MKVFLFFLLVVYAVRCDENNYYVIEMRDDLPTPKPFKVYWNVPTKQCRSKGIPFENLYEKFGIIQNENDHFAGEKISILYDPGLFPALLKNETSGRFRFRNGGVPQEGDLNKHLEAFKDGLDQTIPDKNFDGIGIIDFESWRPVYRQNFGVLRPYKDVSLEIERKLHWWWQKKWLEEEAKRRFEESAHTFMQGTLAFAKQLRPRARWGFYGFPYCFNMASNNMVESCATNVPQENDNISWLWQESTTLYPSVYSSVDLSTSEMTALIRGRVREAGRFHRQILPYFWFRYRDAGFLSQVDLNAALETLYKSNASGFIIWGSSSDVNTVQKCTKLVNYIEQVMGPAVAKYTKPRKIHDENDITTVNDTSSIAGTTKANDVTTTNNPTTTVGTNRIKDLDPEYHWTPPENYTQDIKDHVAEEISKKLSNYTGTGDNNTVPDNNVLIDLILNSILNTNVSNSEDNTTDISNVDREFTRIEDKNDSSNEWLSSTTTLSTSVQETGFLSVSNNAVTIDDECKEVHLLLETTSRTEGTKSVETTTNDNSHRETSHYDSLDIDVTEYAIPRILTDKSAGDTTRDTSRSENKNKTFMDDSTEDYFDFTTVLPLSTETTELVNPKIEVTESTTGFSDYTTNTDILTSEEASAVTIALSTNNIQTTTKDSLDILDISRENSKLNESDTFPTESNDFNQNHSQTTTIRDKNYSSTTESNYLNAKTALKQNTGTENSILIQNNETMQGKSEENTKNKDIISTTAPDLNVIENKSTMEAQNIEENTSLAPTSTSPEQVVFHV